MIELILLFSVVRMRFIPNLQVPALIARTTKCEVIEVPVRENKVIFQSDSSINIILPSKRSVCIKIFHLAGCILSRLVEFMCLERKIMYGGCCSMAAFITVVGVRRTTCNSNLEYSRGKVT